MASGSDQPAMRRFVVHTEGGDAERSHLRRNQKESEGIRMDQKESEKESEGVRRNQKGIRDGISPAVVPKVVKGDPRQPLRLVVELGGHVKEDAHRWACL